MDSDVGRKRCQKLTHAFLIGAGQQDLLVAARRGVVAGNGSETLDVDLSDQRHCADQAAVIESQPSGCPGDDGACRGYDVVPAAIEGVGDHPIPVTAHGQDRHAASEQLIDDLGRPGPCDEVAAVHDKVHTSPADVLEYGTQRPRVPCTSDSTATRAPIAAS